MASLVRLAKDQGPWQMGRSTTRAGGGLVVALCRGEERLAVGRKEVVR